MARNWDQLATRNYIANTIRNQEMEIENKDGVGKAAGKIAQRLVTVEGVPQSVWDDVADSLTAIATAFPHPENRDRIRTRIQKGFKWGRNDPQPLPPLGSREPDQTPANGLPAKVWTGTRATRWLIRWLSENGPVTRRVAIAAGVSAGHKERSIDRAAAQLSRDGMLHSERPKGSKEAVWSVAKTIATAEVLASESIATTVETTEELSDESIANQMDSIANQTESIANFDESIATTVNSDDQLSESRLPKQTVTGNQGVCGFLINPCDQQRNSRNRQSTRTSSTDTPKLSKHLQLIDDLGVTHMVPNEEQDPLTYTEQERLTYDIEEEMGRQHWLGQAFLTIDHMDQEYEMESHRMEQDYLTIWASGAA